MASNFRTPNFKKIRKMHKGLAAPSRKFSKGGYTLHTGDFALKAMSSGRLTGEQYESARRTVSRVVKKFADVNLPLTLQIVRTSKAVGVRMGGGKGSIDGYVLPIEPGRIIMVISGNVGSEMAVKALTSAGYKLPFKTKVIAKRETII